MLKDCIKRNLWNNCHLPRTGYANSTEFYQIIQIGEADLLRRAMGKKIQKEMNAQKKRFINGCVSKGLKDNESNKIFDLLSKFAAYGFNKSHAAAYALIAFQTGYLKAHHPIEFFAASMSLDINNIDKLAIFQQELTRIGIKLFPPNVNISKSFFVRIGDGIGYALGAIKNVGIEAIKELEEERNKNGKFKDFDDFLTRVSTSISNKKTLEALACAGAFDTFKIKRSQIFNQCQDIIKNLKDYHSRNQSSQVDIFGETKKFTYKFIASDSWKEEYKLMKEFEILGFYLSGHPISQYQNSYKELNIVNFSDIKGNENRHNEKSVLIAGTLLSKKEKRSARGNAYAFLNFSDLSSIYELIIFDANLRKYRDILIEGNSYAIGVDFSSDNGSLRGEAKKIYKIEEVVRINAKSVTSEKISSKEFEADISSSLKKNILKIYADEDTFSLSEFKQIKLINGEVKMQIIYINQRLNLPNGYKVDSSLIKEIELLTGVNKAVLE